MKTTLLATLAILTITACATTGTGDGGGQPTTAKEAEAYLANKTNLFQYENGTTEIEYTSADGSSYYWVPLNDQMIKGEWRVSGEGTTYEICFRYPTGSIQYYEEIANQSNWGVWECEPQNDLLQGGLERAEGNPLGLKDGSVPFKIEFEQPYNMAEIAKRTGIDPTKIRYLPVLKSE